MNKFFRYIIWMSIVTFLFVLLLGVFNKAHVFFNNFIYPIQHYFYTRSVNIKDFIQNWDEYQNLAEENNSLLEKNIQLELLNSQLKELKNENEFLKTQLDFMSQQEGEYQLANVIGKSISDYEHILYVDKGKLDGIQEGYPVVVNDGVLIGKIYKVYNSYSIVLLVIDNNSATAVSIQNQDNTLGVVNGEYGLSMKIDYIPKTQELKMGDKVVTSGLERFVPRGLLIGKIDSIDFKEGELFKSAVVKPLIDYNKIIRVNILYVDEE